MNNDRPKATQYSTWHYLGRGQRPPSYYIIVNISWHEGKVDTYTLYNLCVQLDAFDMKAEEFERLLTEGGMQPWRPTIIIY